MKLTTWKSAVLLLLLALCGCAPAPAVRMVGQSQTLPPPDTTSAAGVYQGDSEYRVGAQDLLQISVFGVPDLSRDVRVSSDGRISLPLIGTVQAGGHTIPELEASIGAQLAKTYLQNPQVSVFVKEYTSQRVTLVGSLKNPGIYPLTGKTTLLQAVAMGGGLDPLAQRDGVVVFRTVHGKKMAAVFDIAKISTGQEADPRIYGDDMIVVAQSGSKNALQKFIQTAPVMALFFLL